MEDENHEKVTGVLDGLRGVRLDRVLRGGARLLQNAQGSDATYRLSEPVVHLDAFVSHNWCVSRVKKWIALCFHYNMSLAVCASLLVGLPCAGLALVGNVAVLVHLPLSAVCGMLAFFAFLLFGHDLLPFHMCVCVRGGEEGGVVSDATDQVMPDAVRNKQNNK